ncbi:MAG: cell division protein [Qipengyuania sp.]|jgi:cell division transport system permease protein|nr:cell division protein [Qipengyuania sp.]
MRAPSVFARAIGRGQAGLAGARAARVLPATRLGGPMPWVIAIMAALTVLAAGGALALANFAERTRAGLEGGLTVQIVEADPAARDGQAARAAQALARQPGVASVRPVPRDELARLVEPWLGEAAQSDAVALPALIDVALAGPADEARLSRLRSELARVAPAARLDPQADWLGPVFETIRALRWLALTLIAMLTAASAAAVWLAARNAFDANRETIEIVHHLGGNDTQIAGIFQRSVLIDSALGAVLGAVLGAAVLVLLGERFGALQSGVVESGSLSTLDWLGVALVPVVMVGVALLTARRTVMVRLGRML